MQYKKQAWTCGWSVGNCLRRLRSLNWFHINRCDWIHQKKVKTKHILLIMQKLLEWVLSWAIAFPFPTGISSQLYTKWENCHFQSKWTNLLHAFILTVSFARSYVCRCWFGKRTWECPLWAVLCLMVWEDRCQGRAVSFSKLQESALMEISFKKLKD